MRHAGRFWNGLQDDDKHGLASLVDLYYETQDRVAAMMSSKRSRTKVLDGLVREARHASARANVQGFIIPLPCQPKIVVSDGHAAVTQRWLVTGAHIAVILGLLELYIDNRIDRLAKCAQCSRFYLKTPTLRVACSVECKQKKRLQDIARNVKHFRGRQRL